MLPGAAGTYFGTLTIPRLGLANLPIWRNARFLKDPSVQKSIFCNNLFFPWLGPENLLLSVHKVGNAVVEVNDL